MNDAEKQQQLAVAHGVTDGNKKDAALRLAREALTAPSPMIIYTALAAIDEALGDV